MYQLVIFCLLALISAANANILDIFFQNRVESDVLADFGDDFFWGLGTASTHVEDELDDGWLEFAEEGHVTAWKNAAIPEQRLKFWTQPEDEIDLAADTGVTVFRMGLDWGRLVPELPRDLHGDLAPGHGQGQIQDQAALRRYGEIIDMIKARKMKVMLTMFHHSLPKWAAKIGGWANPVMTQLFADFVQDASEVLGHDVDLWNTFNEPTVFVLLTYCDGMWPPGIELSTPGKLVCLLVPKAGDYSKAMSHIADAHRVAHKIIKKNSPRSLVGVAHNVGWHEAFHFWDGASVNVINRLLTFPFIDDVIRLVDFVGLNYYGKEIHNGASVILKDDEEYSESGRTVYPQGMYDLLVQFNDRYKKNYPNVKYVVTENGISDTTDILRPSFIIEHLLAIKQAIMDGVPVLGYLHWTISDNWEWKDGYCPKFGLVNVDRENNLKRTKLPSYFLFSDIVKTGTITNKQRVDSWQLIQDAVASGTTRPMCRDKDGQTGLDEPWQRPIVDRDWRFDGFAVEDQSLRGDN